MAWHWKQMYEKTDRRQSMRQTDMRQTDRRQSDSRTDRKSPRFFSETGWHKKVCGPNIKWQPFKFNNTKSMLTMVTTMYVFVPDNIITKSQQNHKVPKVIMPPAIKHI